MQIRLTIFLIAFSWIVGAQPTEDLPTIDWTECGNKSKLMPSDLPVVQYQDYRDTLLGDDQSLGLIFDQFPEGVQVHFGPGTYRFKDQIRLKSRTQLIGKSPTETFFIFDLKEEKDLILVQGNQPGKSYPVAKSPNELVSEVPLSAEVISNFKKGDYVYLSDNLKVESWWAQNKVGQIFQIDQIEKETIQLKSNLRRTYDYDKEPTLTKYNMVEDVIIRNLSIWNMNATNRQTSNIVFRYAANCTVDQVESINANYSHVLIEFSTHCTVSDSKFHEAFEYGNGGKGYGITLEFATGDCLLEGNELYRLRHAILLQAGANGNVIYNNYSHQPYWEGVFLPKNSAGDLVLHGNYPYANLFEKNVCQNLVIDNSHGVNGPHNVFFANRIEDYGIVMNKRSSAGLQYFIGNEITGTGFLKGKYRLTGLIYEYGNKASKKHKIFPQNTSDPSVVSFWKN